MKRTRKLPDDRKSEILQAAVDLCVAEGYGAVTRDRVAERAGASNGLVTHYYNTMPQLRRALMRHAIEHDIYAVIAQGIMHGDKHVAKISDEQRTQARNYIASSL